MAIDAAGAGILAGGQLIGGLFQARAAEKQRKAELQARAFERQQQIAQQHTAQQQGAFGKLMDAYSRAAL